MKANVITPGSCKLALGSLTTLSIDLDDVRVIKTAGLQRDYVITTRRRPFCRPDGRHGCKSMPAVVVISICLLYPALSVMLGPTDWSAVNETPYYHSPF